MSSLAFAATLVALALVATWAVGALVLGAWRLAWGVSRIRPALARWAPLCLLAPPVLGGAATLAVVLPTGHGCHCALDAALHLCVTHPERSLALLPVALLVLGLSALRVIPHLSGLVGRARASRALAAGRRVFAKVAEPVGNALSLAWPRPCIVVDRAWWRALRPLERRIVLAHEGAHLRRADPLVLEACALAARLVPGRLARRCLTAWREHAERQADAAAARAVGDSFAVASLLVDLHRRALPSALGMAMHDGRGLEARVRALLDGSTTLRLGSDLGRSAAPLLGLTGLLPVLAADHVHHVLEAVLRIFA